VTAFFETLINGLAVGSLYALIALGYTMVYGILKFINFAHSDVFVVGAWFSLTLATRLGWGGASAAHPAPWWAGPLVLLAAMAFCGVLGFFIERFAYRPLRQAPRLNVLITAIGVSLLLQNTGQLKWFFGPTPRNMPALIPDRVLGHVAGAAIRLEDVIVAGTALGLMLALEWLVFRTKLGRGMRAVSFNPSNAALMGVPVDRVISFTFVTGATLAAAAGFLYALKYPGLNQPAYSTWVLLGLKAFVAAVVGGIGNVRGAMLGGILIGLIEFFGVRYTSPDYRDVFVFAILILVLLFRPTGLLGRATVEKV
jgi:branched-chain amino acid transport system permease protein